MSKQLIPDVTLICEYCSILGATMTLMMMSLTKPTNSGEEGSIYRVGGDEGRE